MAIRNYIPMHIYNSASGHLFGPEELKGSPTGPQLRPEYATLRAYAAGNIEVLLRCLSCRAGSSCRSLKQDMCRRQDSGESLPCVKPIGKAVQHDMRPAAAGIGNAASSYSASIIRTAVQLSSTAE